jgi:SAM-dependent methyltransferase
MRMDTIRDDWNAGFLGGPPRLFEKVGKEQLVVLLEHGLTFESRVLDIGCGCLRGGRWIIPLLHPGHYCGIEPQRQMVERGLREFMDLDVVALKTPRFDFNDRFDFSVFDTEFSHFLARSIWTHASKPQIELVLDGVAWWGAPGAVLLASFNRATWLGRKDYKGTQWVGRSHISQTPGGVAHKFAWIQKACKERQFTIELVKRPPLHRQVWAAIRKPD